MKWFASFKSFRTLLGLSVVLSFAWGPSLYSQDVFIPPPDPDFPQAVVTIETVDPVATEPGVRESSLERPEILDPAVMMVRREGGLMEESLAVFYQVRGTASNGEDYLRLEGEIIIPAGARAARLIIVPLSDDVEEGEESVEVHIVPPVCVAIYPPPPGCYLVGSPGAAKAVIRDGEGDPTNIPPRVTITRPESGAVFGAGDVVTIAAVTKDEDGFASFVEILANGEKIGEQEIVFVQPPPPGEPLHFSFDWTNAPAGPHVLTVVARDNLGARSVSDPVRILVESSGDLPVVTVVATDPEAAEPDPVPEGQLRPIILDFGVFTISRSGDASGDLSVFFRIHGTATNGEDYEMIHGWATIPDGAKSVDVQVSPIDDDLFEGPESVVLGLVQPPIFDPRLDPDRVLEDVVISPLPPTYRVGEPSMARVVIADNDDETNHPPGVHIVHPTPGAVFVAPTDIRLLASAADRDGKVVSVEFFAGDRSLGQAEQDPRVLSILNPYYLLWENVQPGTYVLTALATDDDGAQSKSEPVRIKVLEEEPPTDLPPVVRIRAVDPVGSEWDGFGGTPTATFKISRSGSTDNDLVVFHEIGGTAVNGRDYEFIPVRTLIPAGESSTLIDIIPIQDDIDERPETVKLSLILPPVREGEPRLFPPPYHIGRPGKAAVLIIDHGRPRPPCIRLDDGLFHVCRPSGEDHCFAVQVSLDMRHWETVGEASDVDGAVHFVDPEGDMFKRRFYRVIPVPCPEPEER